MMAEDPEALLHKLEFDAFVEFFVESSPAAVIGCIIFFLYTLQELDVGSGSFYFEVSILFLSVAMSLYNVQKTFKLVIRKSRRHGFTMLQYLYSRIQFSDLEMAPMLPFLGGLQKGTVKHCNFAGHRFRASDVSLLEDLIAPALRPGSAPAKSLCTVQISPYCLKKLHRDLIYRLGKIFYRRNMTQETQNLTVYVVKIEEISDFQNLWNKMDEDDSGLVDLKEFQQMDGASTAAFKKISPNQKNMYKQDLFKAMLFDSTGHINGMSHASDMIEYAVKQGPPKFMIFCLGLKCHLTLDFQCRRFHIGNDKYRDLLTWILESKRKDQIDLLTTAIKYDSQLIHRSVNYHAIMNDEENLQIIMDNAGLIHSVGAQGVQDMMEALLAEDIEAEQFDAGDVLLLGCLFMNLTPRKKKKLAKAMVEKINASNSQHLIVIFERHDLLDQDLQMALTKQGIALGMTDMLQSLDEKGGGLEKSLDFAWLGDWPIFKYVLDQMTESMQFILKKVPEEGCDKIYHEVEKRFWKWVGRKGQPAPTQMGYIEDLLESYPPSLIDKFNKQGYSPLSFAIAAGNAWLVEQLLSNGVSVNIADSITKLTPLGMIFTLQQIDRNHSILDSILQAPNLDPNVQTAHGYPVLIAACADVDPTMVEFLLNKQADINFTGANGYAFLHAVCMFSIDYDEDVSDSVCTEGSSQSEVMSKPSLNKVKTKGVSHLFGAGSRHYLEDDFLPSSFKGLDKMLSAEDSESIIEGEVEMKDELSNFEVDTDGEITEIANTEEPIRDRASMRARTMYTEVTNEKKSLRSSGRAQTMFTDHREVDDTMLDAMLDELSDQQDTFTASWMRMKDVALSREDVNIDLVTMDGKTPLLLAIEHGHEEIVNVLIDRNCDLNAHDSTQHNLYRAALNIDHDVLFERLIDLKIMDSPHPEGSALSLCVQQMKAFFVRRLLNIGSDINAYDDNGYTPLMHACRMGDDNMATMLLKADGIKINAQNSENETALILATKQEHVSIVKKLLDFRADGNVVDQSGHSALHYAITDGLEKIVDLLIDAPISPEHHEALAIAIKCGEESIAERILNHEEIDVNLTDNGRNTLLFHAAHKDMYRIVEMLIEIKADVNTQNDLGNTALMNAVSREDERMITLLIEARANPDAIDVSGVSSLSWACQHQMESIIPLLIENGVDLEQENSRGETALHFAAQQQNIVIAQSLLTNKADPNHRDNEGNTPLLLALDMKNHAIIELMLNEHSVDVNKQNKLFHTPLIVATWKKDMSMVTKLFERKADPNIADERGWTPLMYACYDGALVVAKYLVEVFKADVSLRNKDGKSSVDIAIAQNQRGIVALFENLDLTDADQDSINDFKKKRRRQGSADMRLLMPQEDRTIHLAKVASQKVEPLLPSVTIRKASFGDVEELTYEVANQDQQDIQASELKSTIRGNSVNLPMPNMEEQRKSHSSPRKAHSPNNLYSPGNVAASFRGVTGLFGHSSISQTTTDTLRVRGSVRAHYSEAASPNPPTEILLDSDSSDDSDLDEFPGFTRDNQTYKSKVGTSLMNLFGEESLSSSGKARSLKKKKKLKEHDSITYSLSSGSTLRHSPAHVKEEVDAVPLIKQHTFGEMSEANLFIQSFE